MSGSTIAILVLSLFNVFLIYRLVGFYRAYEALRHLVARIAGDPLGRAVLQSFNAEGTAGWDRWLARRKRA